MRGRWDVFVGSHLSIDLNRQILAKYRVGDYTPAEAENAASTMSDSS
jgi:hypothetical protein